MAVPKREDILMKNKIENLEKRIQYLEDVISKTNGKKSRNDRWEELLNVVRIQNKRNKVQA
tara:strand:+ start:4644 stop:4826 length:183 start_codon:yes stop_codon:yes gene_type:complete